MMRRTTFYFSLAVVLLTYGCGREDEGELIGDLLLVRECEGDVDAIFQPYEMKPTFFAVQQLGEVAFVRMQPGGTPLHRTDAFVIQLNDVDFIRERLGRELPIDSPKVRATLHVLGSCPDTTQAMTAHSGHVKFDEFGSERGERIVGSFVFQLFDDRTQEVVGLGFRGSFDFEVKVGQPYQPFSQP